MKPSQVFALAGISMLAMSNSCEKENISPTPGLTTGRLIQVENTIDGTGQNPRPRWIIDLAPLSLAGYQGVLYQQAKVFNLPASTTYQVGQSISFHYQLVPYAQQTPWRTGYEWSNAHPTPVGADNLPEIIISDTSK